MATHSQLPSRVSADHARPKLLQHAPKSRCVEEERFHGLPPLKRFKILQKEQQELQQLQQKRNSEMKVCCLPAKKRVCALQIFTVAEEKENAAECVPGRQLLAKKKEGAPRVLQPLTNHQIAGTPKAAKDFSGTGKEKRRADGCSTEKALASREAAPMKSPERTTSIQGDEEEEDDDGIFCNVCKEADADESDPIVFCDGCDVMVHASCYGRPLMDGIPSGDWFCERCEEGSCKERCHLCPSREGAMKRTTGGRWAHLSCALFVPEVFYRRAREKEGIECSRVPPWRWAMACSLCGRADQGACIQCTEVGCTATFHVSCGLDRGLPIDYRHANALTRTPAIVIAFCPLHSPRWQQMLAHIDKRRFRIVPRD